MRKSRVAPTPLAAFPHRTYAAAASFRYIRATVKFPMIICQAHVPADSGRRAVPDLGSMWAVPRRSAARSRPVRPNQGRGPGPDLDAGRARVQGAPEQLLHRLSAGVPYAARGMAAVAALDHGLCGLHAPALAAAVQQVRAVQHAADVRSSSCSASALSAVAWMRALRHGPIVGRRILLFPLSGFSACSPSERSARSTIARRGSCHGAARDSLRPPGLRGVARHGSRAWSPVASSAATSRRGTPMWWRELQAQNDLWSPLPGPDKSLIVDPTAIIVDGVVLDASRGPIIIGARTKICRGAHLQGPLRSAAIA